MITSLVHLGLAGLASSASPSPVASAASPSPGASFEIPSSPLLAVPAVVQLRPDHEIPSMATRPPDERWIALGYYDVDTEYDDSDVEGDDDGAYSYCAGTWWWGDTFGTAAEAQITYSHHRATVDGEAGHLATWNVMVGARLGWKAFDHRLVAYARGGGLWRTDNGDDFTAISDDGFGVYGGLGVEARLTTNLALAPEVMWTWADVAEESSQSAVGVSLVIRF